MSDLTLYTSGEVADLLRLHPQVVQRKLQAGEIPGYRIGREWRVERAQLLEWLERHSNQRDPIDRFFARDGRLRTLPSKREDRLAVLKRISAVLTPGRTYPESELNELLRRFDDDVAALRRELVMAHYVVRTTSGVYKRTSPGAI